MEKLINVIIWLLVLISPIKMMLSFIKAIIYESSENKIKDSINGINRHYNAKAFNYMIVFILSIAYLIIK